MWANVRGEHCRVRRDRETHRRMNKRDENTWRDQHHSWRSRHILDSHPTHTSPMDTPTIHQHSLHFPLNESTVQWQATSRNRWSAICHRVREVGDDHLTIQVHMNGEPDQCGTFTEPFAWWLISWTSDVNQKNSTGENQFDRKSAYRRVRSRREPRHPLPEPYDPSLSKYTTNWTHSTKN